jgi:hypothetical protein
VWLSCGVHNSCLHGIVSGTSLAEDLDGSSCALSEGSAVPFCLNRNVSTGIDRLSGLAVRVPGYRNRGLRFDS